MNAPECGTDTVVNVRTAAGCRPASAHATAAPQSCPTTWTDQRDDVADEMRHPVRADAAGAGERRVAALVRRDRAIAVGIQPRRDARPALRRLRPAVQQHDDLAVERARIDGVESQSIVVERGDAARFIQGRFS
ncbi:hypothetical protein Y044_5204 [Burkholderia pseudomallei MSHR2243]|nr:hypothetical protein Y044_5204 [Burkholderia pseudomallei MSHR2243]